MMAPPVPLPGVATMLRNRSRRPDPLRYHPELSARPTYGPMIR